MFVHSKKNMSKSKTNRRFALNKAKIESLVLFNLSLVSFFSDMGFIQKKVKKIAVFQKKDEMVTVSEEIRIT